jgi:hydrogenase/urease accessory protein HupE
VTSSSAPVDRRRKVVPRILVGVFVPVVPAVSVVLVLLALTGPAAAHDESVSASDVVVKGAEVTWTVDVGVAGLAKVIPFGQQVSGAERTVDKSEIDARREAIADYLARSLTVTLDGQPVVASRGALTPRYETLPGAAAPAITRVALELRFRAPRPIAELRARVAFFSDLTGSHRAVLRVGWDQEWKQTTALGVTELHFQKGKLTPSRVRVLGEFVLWGVHHILMGFDHLAFLLALMLAIVKVRTLLLVITSFTVAHSITILLAAMEVVRMPPAITEALIAASIVYVAGENLLLGRRAASLRGRWLMTFAFGLVHGLGFAEVLRERLAEVPEGIVMPVLAFNLGVELGQVAVVAAVFPLLRWLRGCGATSSGWETRQKQIVQLGSVPILVAGLYWLFQRLS